MHTPRYLQMIEDFCAGGGGPLDPDTVASQGSWGTALLAAGGALAAVDALTSSRDGVAFVAHRPPGHHATADQAMGFCLLNNVAIAAAALLARGERVLVLDWDVHHGNGTEAIFWDEPGLFYVSTHQSPLYPGTGDPRATGGANAPALNMNIPLPPGATGDVLLYAFDEIVAPAVEDFRPSWVLISSGFDAHASDPLANLELSAGDFADLAARAKSFAPSPGTGCRGPGRRLRPQSDQPQLGRRPGCPARRELPPRTCYFRGAGQVSGRPRRGRFTEPLAHAS